MTKFIKLLLSLSILLVLLVVIVLAGFIMLFDPNEHKDFIISKVEAQTGRELKLTGNINMTFYPWLGLEAEGITLGNAKGFGEEPFLHADLVAMRIKTMPLLNKQYELDTLKLHGVKINLAKDKKGNTNWQDLAGETPADKKDKATPVQLAAVILGGVDIQQGQLSWHDLATEQQVNVKEITVTTGELTYGAPINLAVAFNTEMNKPDLSSKLKMNGILNYDLDTEIYAFKPIDLIASISGKEVPGGSTDLVFKAAMETNLAKDTFKLSDLSLELLGTHIQGDLSAENVKSGKPFSKAQFSVLSKDLTKLIQLVDPEAAKGLAQLNDKTVDMKLTMESDVARDTVRLSNMDIKVLGAIIQGQIEASHLQDQQQPSARGILKAQGPDLPALMQVIGQFETGEDAKLKDLGQRLSGHAEKTFDVVAEFDTDMEKGNILVPDFSVKTLGINAHGKLDGKKINSSSPSVDGKFSLKGEKLEGLLSALDKKELGSVLQAVNVDTNVSSKGGDIVLSPLQVQAVFSGKQIPNSPATVALNADTRINPDKQTIFMDNMTLKGLGLDVSGNINASKIKSGSPAMRGNLKARGSDLALLFKLAEIEPLASQMSTLKDRSFSIDSGLDLDMEKGQVKVSNLNAQLVGATIQGQVEASNIKSKTPAARGTLNASGPDLPTLMQIAGKLSGPESGLADLGQKLSSAPNKAFKVSTEFNADLSKGNIDLPALDINSLGLNIKGQLKARNMEAKTGAIDGLFSLKGKEIGAILTALGQAPLAEVLQSINIDAGIQGNTSDVSLSPLDIKAVLAGKQIPNSPVNATFKADTRVNLTDQTLSINNLALNGLGLNVSGNMNGTKIIDNPNFIGAINIAEFNLKNLATQLNQELPKTADKNVLQKVALKTGFNGSKNSLGLQDLTMQLDESIFKGDLSVKHFTQPTIKLGLGINEINVDRYLPPEDKNKSGKKEQPDAQADDASIIPVEFLRTLNAEGDILIGKLIIANTRLSDVKLSLRAKEGDIRLNPAAANLYSGSYNGSVIMDVREKVPSIQFASNLKDVQIEPLMIDFTREKESQLAGVANLEGQVNTRGFNVKEFKRSLNGQVKFNVQKGILRGIDVRKALEQAEIMIESKRPGNIDKGGETPFDRLSGTLDIKNGVVGNNDLIMTSPGFKLTGKGMLANLNDNAIKYNMKVGVEEKTASKGTERYNLGGYDIPIICRGLITQISDACAPDYGELLGVIIKKGALEKIGEAIGIDVPKKKKSTTADPGTTSGSSTESTDSQSTQQQSKDNPVEQLKDVIDIFKGF